MSKRGIPVRKTAQHFTIDKKLIADAIRVASIKSDDTILDIGGGKGAISQQLVHYCNAIITIENDARLYELLKSKFREINNVKIVFSDINLFSFPKSAFKCVSNIPYKMTSGILRLLMYENYPFFIGGAIIMQLEVGKKMTSNVCYNPLLAFYRSFYEIKMERTITPFSFHPPPTVNSALVSFRKKDYAIATEVKRKYFAFLNRMYRNPDQTILSALKSIFRKRDIRVIAKDHALNLELSVYAVPVSIWVLYFEEMLANVPEKFHPC